MAESSDGQHALKSFYDSSIIPAGITATGKSSEIIDIITDYPWSATPLNSRQTKTDKVSFTHNIPFCYAIERRQTVGSNITSLINTILGQSMAMTGAISRAAISGSSSIGNLMGNAQKAESTAKTADQAAKQQEGQSTGTGTGTNTQTGDTAAAQPKPANPENAKAGDNAGSGNGKKQQNSSSGNGIASGAASAAKAALGAASTLAKGLESLIDDVATSTARIDEGNLGKNQFLNPWKWLYMTQTTGKQFVFPAFSAGDMLKITNAWGEQNDKSSTDGTFKAITDWTGRWAEIFNLVANLADMFPKEKGSVFYEGYNVEKAKGFNYDANSCSDFQCNFPLFNTTQKDAWKKNYRFLMMFLLRNCALRTSMYSFIPPLLYDIIIPGVKHLPICCVQSISITSQGHIRTMQGENVLSELVSDAKNKTTYVPVPEAWVVTIIFKCLIPDTMNLLLSTTNFPINITTVKV